jgi:transposase
MRRIDMEKAKEILRLHHQYELSHREIAEATGCSVGTVSNVLTKAKEAGVGYPTPLSAKELGSLLYPPVSAGKGQVKPDLDLGYIHREMQKKGVTLTLLWEEYKTEHPDGYMLTQFCKRYSDFRKENDVYMRKHYKAGERMLVDWAGQTMKYTDAKGKEVPVHLFVSDLPASSYLYVEAFRGQGEKSWIDGHIHAFAHYGGVPRILVPDNTKTAVTKARYYDPELNKTYRDMAGYYGAVVIPARRRKPKDKAPVETGVQIVERRIIAKLRNRRFLSYEELCIAVCEELETVNTRQFQKLLTNRRALFLETERDALMPLSQSKYEYAAFKKVKAAFDYHVPYDKHYYSIPYLYAGKHVEIRATSRMIEVLYGGERIALHARSYDRYARYVTEYAHMPKRHRVVSEWSPERFASWAAKTGPSTERYIKTLLAQRDHPEQAYKTCAGILRLADTIGAEQMEEACGRALEQNIYTYKYFDILLRNMTAKTSRPISHQNLRGKGYYGGGSHA